MLQGRLFSYLDTQLSRLGSPNFHQLPINLPHNDVTNQQRDALMQGEVPSGRTAYEPNSIEPDGPRESADGFRTHPSEEQGQKLRIRPESFADHFTQARLFWESMTEPEQRHIVGGFAFELGKCEFLTIRRRMLGQLENVSSEFAARVAEKLGMEGQADSIQPAAPVRDVEPSPALSQ